MHLDKSWTKVNNEQVELSSLNSKLDNSYIAICSDLYYCIKLLESYAVLSILQPSEHAYEGVS